MCRNEPWEEAQRLIRCQLTFFPEARHGYHHFMLLPNYKIVNTAKGNTQGNSTYSPGLKKHRNIEEFLTTKAHQGAEGRNKAPFHASFVRLIRLSG
jgi:hypothetical protein